MKIGILTFHRAFNHGAVLQCLALQRTLTEMGHDVGVIDYRQEYIERVYSPFRFLNVSGNLRKMRRCVGRCVAKFHFNGFVRKHLPIIPMKGDKVPDGLDAYVIGSDQVWSKVCTGFVDKVYFGEFNHKQESRLIGYGISAPVELVEEINPGWLCERVHAFDSISFREPENTRYISELTGRVDVATVLDPTLLQPRSFYEGLADVDVPESIVVMVYRYRMSDEDYDNLLKHVKVLANVYGCEVVDVMRKKMSPSEWLSWIKNAKVVITNSFHATVFSLTFHKPLCITVSGDNLDSRYLNLLKSVGTLSTINDEKTYIDLNPNYNEVDERLTHLRIHSLEFLNKNLT